MAKKKKSKNKTDKTINILIVACIVAIIALIGLVAFSIGNSSGYFKSVEKKIERMDIAQNPEVIIEMESGGIIKLELYPKTAPNTVCNFISLAESGFYDGLIFHRCIKNFMIQGGDPEGTGMGDPGYSIKGEFSNNDFENNITHERGVISMARNGFDMDSGGSQFFIMVADSPYLDGDYAAFGKVVEGMDVTDAIVSEPTDENDKPLNDQIIKKITVNTFGIEYPEPEIIK